MSKNKFIVIYISTVSILILLIVDLVKISKLQQGIIATDVNKFPITFVQIGDTVNGKGAVMSLDQSKSTFTFGDEKEGYLWTTSINPQEGKILSNIMSRMHQ